MTLLGLLKEEIQFPFSNHIQVFLCETSPICHLKDPYIFPFPFLFLSTLLFCFSLWSKKQPTNLSIKVEFTF